MKFFAALTTLLAASASADQAKYIRHLLSNAKPTENSKLGRRLDQNGQVYEEFQINIAKYSVKFEQCQFVKSYDEEMAQADGSSTVLATKRFVMFRLCPSDCGSCNSNYGEYLVDLDSYLEATVQYFQNYQQGMCNACNNQCQQEQAAEGDAAADQNADANNGARFLQQNNYAYTVDCTTCYDECQKIENMEANGYVDASNFLQCQMIYDPEDDQRAPLYAGPICASSGTKIKIGVFTDENCLYLDSTKDVDDYLVGQNGQMKLSHALLKNTYTNTCISCKEPQDANANNQGDDANDADEVAEICENLYDTAAKCETQHSFADSIANYYGYENQLAQEQVVCEFMQSLKSGTYDEQGEIVVSGANVSSGGGTTGGQKFALTFFILGTVGLAVYAAMLHSKLVKGAKTELTPGGAMA